jgi:signal transduction histidine kinase
MAIDALASGWTKAVGLDRKQFDMFFDKMLDGFAYHRIVVDKAGQPVDYVFLEVNQAFEKMTGLKREKIMGKKVTEVLVGIEKDPANWIGVYGKVALMDEPVQFENYNEALSKWFKVVAYCPEKGYFVALFEDITESKKVKAQMQRQNAIVEGVNSIFQAAFSARTEEDLGEICLEVAEKVTGSKFGFIGELNPKGLEYIAISNPGWEGCKIIDKSGHRRPSSNFELHGIYGRVLKNGKSFFTNTPSEHPDSIGLPVGHPALEAFLGVALKREGKTIGMIAVGNREEGYSQNELEALEALAPAIVQAFLRKRAEEALNKANEELEKRVLQRTAEVSSERQRLYNVLETLPVYVILLDKDYRVPFANKVFRERFGESHGRRCYDFLFKRESVCENCESYKVVKTNGLHRWEWTGPDCRDYDIYDFPFIEADGSTIILEMGIDITERKKLEKQLKDSERLATIGATAGMVGHDIRNPLQAITSDLFLAKSELSELPENQQKTNAIESLDEIQNNLDYINKIVADLQDFARPLNPHTQETDIKLLVNEILAKNGIPKNIKLDFNVEGKAEKIVADPHYIKRIVANLTLNAIQAMPNGGKLTIRAYTDNLTKDILITVKDTGVGIPEDIKPKLFTPMMTTKSKGQGFGLAVVKRMTEGLGGTVTFESTEGGGTTFIVHLPSPKELNSKLTKE